jgi:hypothetical protein
MKKQLLILCAIVMLFATACKKDSATKQVANDDSELLAKNKTNGIYKDTTTISLKSPSISNIKHSVNAATNPPTVVFYTITYARYSQYTISAHVNENTDQVAVKYSVVDSNGNKVFDFSGSSISAAPLSGTFTLSPGTYSIHGYWYGTGLSVPWVVPSTSFTIYAQPQAPDGMLCMYRYYNPTNHLHMYSTDWDELGSASQGLYFEKVTGYICGFQQPGSIPIYRYYCPSNGDHLYSIKTPPIPPAGYQIESIIGYIYTAPTGASTTLLQRYNSTTLGHFYKTPDDTLPDPSFTFESNLGYLQLPN